MATILRAARTAADAQQVWRETRAILDANLVADVEKTLDFALPFRAAPDERHTHCDCPRADLRWDGDVTVCYLCGVERTHIVHADWKEEWDEIGETGPGRVLKRSYSRAARFRGLLHQFAQALASRTDPDTLIEITGYLRERGVSPAACTATDVRRAIRAFKRPDLYRIAPGITAQLRDETPAIDTRAVAAARCFFDRALAALPRVPPPKAGRRYMASYRLMLSEALAAGGFTGAPVYCPGLTHRRTRARVSRYCGQLARAALEQ